MAYVEFSSFMVADLVHNRVDIQAEILYDLFHNKQSGTVHRAHWF
jgi:hypothetical protein